MVKTNFWFFLFLLNLFLRLASFYTPVLDVDETQFAGFAHVLMDGGLPFRDSLDTKPLGIYLYYWACFALFGKYNLLGVHFVTACLTFITAVFLSKVFKNFDQKKMGRWAALLFIIFSAHFVPKYLSTSINAVMVFFLVAQLYWMSWHQKKPHVLFDVLAGLSLGCGFLFKYTAGIQWVLFFLYTLFQLKEQAKLLPIKKRIWLWFKRNIYFALSFLLPFLWHALYLSYLGVWDDFVEWSLGGSSRYLGQAGSTIDFWQSFIIRFGGYVGGTFFLWFWGMKAFRFTSFKASLFILLFLWFALSLIPVCLGGRFYPHYFIHLLPSLCSLAVLGLFGGLDSFGNPQSQRSWKPSLVLVLAIPSLIFWGMRLDYQKFLTYFPDDQIYQQQEVGLRLKQRAQPGDKLFVWGFATGIYFHSELKAASRFLWADVLTGRTPGPYYARVNQHQESHFANPIAWQAFWDDLKKNRPTYFVDTSPANMHDYGRFPLKNYPGLYAYLQREYRQIETVRGVVIYQLIH